VTIIESFIYIIQLGEVTFHIPLQNAIVTPLVVHVHVLSNSVCCSFVRLDLFNDCTLTGEWS
jgi:hypothetical protein